MLVVTVAMYILIILVCVFLAVFIKYHWSRRHLYLIAAQLPGPPALPILGNALAFYCKPEGKLFCRTSQLVAVIVDNEICIVVKYMQALFYFINPFMSVSEWV